MEVLLDRKVREQRLGIERDPHLSGGDRAAKEASVRATNVRYEDKVQE